MRDAAGHTLFGINVAIGAALMVGSTMVAAVLFSMGEVSARLVVVAIAVGAYAAAVADVRASLATAALGYLLFTGFLVNQYGDLAWDGASSGWHLLVLALPAGLSLASRWIRAAKAEITRAEDLNEIFGNTDSREKEPHVG